MRLEGREHVRREAGSHLVDQRAVVPWRRRQAVDDRQIELGVVGTELIDDAAAVIDQVQVVAHAPDAHGLPLGDRDGDGSGQHASNRGLGDPGRTEELLPP